MTIVSFEYTPKNARQVVQIMPENQETFPFQNKIEKSDVQYLKHAVLSGQLLHH